MNFDKATSRVIRTCAIVVLFCGVTDTENFAHPFDFHYSIENGWGHKYSNIPKKHFCIKSHEAIFLLGILILKSVKLLTAFGTVILLNSVTFYAGLTALTVAPIIPCLLPSQSAVNSPSTTTSSITTSETTTVPTTSTSTTPPTTTTQPTLPTVPTLPTTTPTIPTTTQFVGVTCPPCFCGRGLFSFDETGGFHFETTLLRNEACLERFVCEIKMTLRNDQVTERERQKMQQKVSAFILRYIKSVSERRGNILIADILFNNPSKKNCKKFKCSADIDSLIPSIINQVEG